MIIIFNFIISYYIIRFLYILLVSRYRAIASYGNPYSSMPNNFPSDTFSYFPFGLILWKLSLGCNLSHKYCNIGQWFNLNNYIDAAEYYFGTDKGFLCHSYDFIITFLSI